MPKLNPAKSNPIKRKQLQAYTAGQSAAVGKVLPMLEDKYRLRLTARLGLIVLVACSVAFAAGAAVGVAWARSGIVGF